MTEASDTPTHGSLVLLVIGVGTLLTAMGGSAVALALPQIGVDLGESLDDLSWIMQSFLLVVTALLLIAGRVGDSVGHGRLYLVGFSLFGAAAVLCGLAPSFPALLAGRALQGIGGAMVMATGPALLTTTFPGSQRGRALGIVATATYTGLTLGPPVGGFIVSALGWRWVFFLNLPVAILVVALGVRFLPRAVPPRGDRAPGLDVAGAGTLLVGLPLLLLALSEGRSWGWASAATLGTGLGALALLGVFVAIEKRHRSPLLDLRLFRSPVFSGATVSAVTNYVALFVPLLLMPFYLDEALHLDADQAGLVLGAQPLVMALVASPSGRLSDRIGPRGLATLGLALEGLGLLGMVSLDADSAIAWIVVWQLVIGLGTGIFISPNSSALMGAAPQHQQGVAGGVLAVARNFGMAVGVALAATLFHALGGDSGRAWGAAELDGFHVAMGAAGAVSLL
ncbi:MAG: DHA2 family efflux MFS transporter permease subunit, partial [Deltaproteobacteria bacterium]